MGNFLLDTNFSRFHSNLHVYTKIVGSHLIILFLYVDELILPSIDPKILTNLKTNLQTKFEITDLGYLHYFLGLQVLQMNKGIFISQSKCVCDLLQHFHMDDSKLAPSPFQSRFKFFSTYTTPKFNATLYD
jgi:hypothetical protein